ncbi:MAG: myo-inositol 2-dehydrogenase [Bacteroidetes bacterium HGW-Bacteroidetes-8]|jgi:predicted dehydrogenase|nr:MAG: myo-inositol 2-dehydrogenase [Bacteroidetes bacterium HGW-Bacteroidetes-8]
MEKKIYLIGTGQMALDYAKVLVAQNHQFIVIGRGESSALKFEQTTGIKPITGGINKYLSINSFYENSYVIIATGTQDLMETMLTVLRGGAYRVLVEKPAAISIEELLANEKKLEPYADRVFVAYNRRFYASVIEAQKLIEEDGGLQSIHFEFTEWAHKIEPLEKAPGVKENWFFANSTHVVDLAFHLAGNPVDWQTYSKPGKIKWHKKTNFAGAGITDRGVLFTYLSNWESAGRWSIELYTNAKRIILKPLEEIDILNKGSIVLNKFVLNDSLDKAFKPGLYLQIAAFTNNDSSQLISISNHIKLADKVYNNML